MTVKNSGQVVAKFDLKVPSTNADLHHAACAMCHVPCAMCHAILARDRGCDQVVGTRAVSRRWLAVQPTQAVLWLPVAAVV